MSKGGVFITANKLGGAAHRILEDAGYKPVYLEGDFETEAYLQQIKAAQNIAPVRGVISRTYPFDREHIEALPDLKIICKHGAGYDNINTDHAKASDIAVARVAGANARSVAEHTIALILAVARQIVPLANSTRAGNWDRKSWIGQQLGDKTLGLIGFGQIGKEVCKIGGALCRDVLVYDPFAKAGDIEAVGATPVDLETLNHSADIVSLHCPLTKETSGLLNAAFFAQMRSGSIVINTARGDIINEDDLLTALKSGQLSGAGLDSLVNEGPGQSTLRDLQNVVVTPHIGGSTRQAMEIVAERAARNVVSYLDGDVLNDADIVSLP